MTEATIDSALRPLTEIEGGLQDNATTDLRVDHQGALWTRLSLDGLSDAFGRLRVSEPVLLFDSKLLYDKNVLFWDEVITDNSGNATSTHSTDDASVSMTVEATDSVVRQTKQRFNYQPGKSQQIMLTGLLAGGTGVKSRIGAFDANDGLFFELDDSTLSVVIRKNTTDTAVAQADWNMDKMDGTGPSGITLDTSKAQLFLTDYEWLSIGRVRFGFIFNGVPAYCHEVTNTNALTTPYTSTPNYPIRYEIASAAGGDTATMRHICSAVTSEGGQQGFGITNNASTAGTHVEADVADTIYAIVGIKLKSTHLDAGVHLEKISIINEKAQDFEWMLLLNPTVAGTFTYANVANSAVQKATGALANAVTADSWDLMLEGGFVKSSNQGGSEAQQVISDALGLGSLIDGTPDEFVLAARPLAADADIQGALTWRELL